MAINPMPIPDGSQALTNARQEAFAQAMTGCPPCSASEAWRRAGYAKANADVKAARALVNVGIAARISHLRQQNAKACIISKAEVLNQLSVIVRNDEAKASDRIRAADALAKLCGWYEPEKVNIAEQKVVFNWEYPRPKDVADATKNKSMPNEHHQL